MYTDLNDTRRDATGHGGQQAGIGQLERLALVRHEVAVAGRREAGHVVDAVPVDRFAAQSHHRAARQAVHVRQSASTTHARDNYL